MNTITTVNETPQTSATNDTGVSSTLQKYYNKIFQDGKLMNVHIGMWGMSWTLQEQDIKINDKLPELIKLGRKMLIKPAVYNKFKGLECKMRNYLYKNSFTFPLVAQAHFVPKTRYVEVYTKLTEMCHEYMAMVDEFCSKYEDYKREALEFYEQFKDQVDISDLEQAYPSVEKVRSKFHADVTSFEISLPTEFKQISIHEEIARESKANEAKELVMRQCKQQYDAQVHTHIRKVESFMEEAANTLRSSVVDFCTAALGRINRQEVVSDSHIRTLLKKVRSFRTMNFLEDKTVEEKLSQVENFLQSGRDFVSDKAAISALQTHLTAAVNEAKNISDVANVSGEYFRKLSI